VYLAEKIHSFRRGGGEAFTETGRRKRARAEFDAIMSFRHRLAGSAYYCQRLPGR
jgi:hypothetical protein